MIRTSARPSPPLPGAPSIEQAVLRTVAYADVFDYPLDATEIHRYLHGLVTTPQATAQTLERCLATSDGLGHRDGFYMLRGREGLVDVRRRRTAYARALWPRAVRYGRAIAGLPFVRMVAVTGSLAWENVAPPGDIDYFIVTEADRLWSCRWLVAALGRLARLEGVAVCANYLVSTRALALSERNLYCAYELVRMTPIAGLGMYRRLRRVNRWADAYLPNAGETSLQWPRRASGAAPRWPERLLARLSRLGERSLDSAMGTVLERREMAHRIRKRERQGKRQGEAAYGVDWYKEHLGGHRQHTLAAFADRVRELS